MKEEILLEWNPWWTGRQLPEYVDRDIESDIGKWLDRQEIIPITGSRRSGKTTIMYIIIRELLETVPKENILFIKCDDERVQDGDLIERARERHRELFNPEGRIYMFLDEVQELDNWDRTVKRIYDLASGAGGAGDGTGSRIKIFLTGSRLLKDELCSSLAGRFAYFDVYPFSFREFLRCRGIEVKGKMDMLSRSDELKFHLREYIEWGGFPEIVLEGDTERKRELLGFYSDSILYRDVIKRSGIARVDIIERLKGHLLANVSNLMNYSRIAKHLGISPDTAAAYLHAMESAYYIFPVPLFSYSVKQQQMNPRKIYCIDNGIRNSAGFRFSSDIGRLCENVVYLHLRRKHAGIYYWKTGNGSAKNGGGKGGRESGEVDFVLKEGERVTRAIQVCWDVEDAREREVRPLLAAMEEFDIGEGVVITGDTRETEDHGGRRVRFVPLREWLLEG